MVDLCQKRSRALLFMMLLGIGLSIPPAGTWAQEAGDPALDLYYNANSLCHRRFYKQAVDEYKRFLDKHPNHAKAAKARWGMAISLYNLAKPKEAQPLLTGLVGNSEITAQDQVQNLLGSCLLELGKFSEAEKAFTWTIANNKDPKSKSTTDARVGLVESFYLQSKWKELVKASDLLLTNAPTSPHVDKVRFQGAVARSKLKEYASAAAVFEKLIATSKDTRLVHRAIFRLAECKQLTGKFAEAAEMYSKVAKTSKGVYSEYAHYDLGVVYFLQKDYKKAIEELLSFTKTYSKSKLSPKVRLYLGRAHLEIKDYNRATSYLKQLSEKSDLMAPATLWLARTYARQNSNATVVSILTPVIEKFVGTPEMPGMLNELAAAQMRLRKFPEAAALFGRARALSKPPQSVEFLRLQAFCLNQAKQYDASMKLTEDFLTKHPTDATTPEVLFVKAENLLMLKKATAALAVYMKILSTAPNHPRIPLVNFRVAQIHIGAKQWAQAAQHLTTLLAGDHSDKAFNEANFMLGDCYFHLSKWEETISALETFLDEQPTSTSVDTAIYNLALACQRQKLNEKAIAVLRGLVSTQYVRRDDKGKAVEDADDETLSKKERNQRRQRRQQRAQKYRQTLQKQRHSQKARIELGKLLYEAGIYPEAASHLQTAIQYFKHKKETGDGNAEYYLGWVYLKQNKLKEAAGYFARVAAFPDHPFAQDAALQCSILHIRNKDVKSAEAALKKMMSGPNPIKADQGAYYLGLAMARQDSSGNKKQDEKRYAAALGYFDTVLTKYSSSDKVPNALYWKGKCVEKLPAQGGPGKAVEIFAEFIKKHPTHKLIPDVTIDMGKIQFDAEKYDLVIAAMKGLLNPDAEKKVTGTLRENALYLLGWSYSKTGKTEASAAALEEMAALQNKKGSTNASASFQAGEARMKLHEYQEALKHFRKAVSAGKGPTHAPALLRQAECEGFTNKWDESRRTCQELLKLYPNSPLAPQATFALGWSYENRKQYPQAIEQYRIVIARKKNDALSARAQFQIGECLFVSNKLDDAITELIRVETKYSFPQWSARALLELGRIREAQKNEDEAIKRYNEVIERFPKSAAATVAKSLLRKLQ
ncbi:MAG: tetratricopeptide repeat protein [Phycisphaerae bacterium]|jgi:TolA-binding protein|nr:tetratricopeptide repeat protein [Phycisphaerae bacterium]